MNNEPTILIVDDDPNLTKTLSDIIRLQGYRALAAGKGKTALDRVKEESPAVALIDLKLPDMDGLEVMREIKKRSPGTQCIVLTGYGSQASAIEAINLGAYGYMQKPYDVEQLVVTILRAIEKREAEEALRESEERLGAFMDSADDALFPVMEIGEAWAGAVHQCNEMIFARHDLESVILPLGDGVAVSLKR
jgi:DNA-binding NtrC family response regulator